MKVKSCFIFLLLIILVNSASAFARYCPEVASDGKPVKEISVDKLIPTQYAMGKIAVEEIKAKYRKGGFVKKIRERFFKKPLPVIVGPAGPKMDGEKAYYLKDNHHMVIPVADEYFSKAISKEEALVCVVIDADLSDSKWDDFVRDLYEGKKFGSRLGYFSPEKRTALSNEDPKTTQFQSLLLSSYEELFSHNLSQLVDVPFRSVIAEVMTIKLGIKGEDFKEYIEFLLAEKIQSILGNSFDPHSETAHLEVFKVMFGESDILRFWKSQIKPNLKSKKRDKIFKIMDDSAEFCRRELSRNASYIVEAEQLEELNYFYDTKENTPASLPEKQKQDLR
jgi:hypothetical protein